MSGVPPSLAPARDFLHAQTGLPFVSLGIVGDSRHTRGYHCGRDRIYSATGLHDADYSVKTARDRAGLTDFASAMDIGNFHRLREFSIWLVSRARGNSPDTRDMREIIFSPDGVHVLRWDRERGVASQPRSGEADNSHLTHTHVSWYRDSHSRDQQGVFRAFFAPKVQPSEEDMKAFAVFEKRAYVSLRLGAHLFDDSKIGADGKMIMTPRTIIIDPARDTVYVGTLTDDIRIIGYEAPGAPDANTTSQAMFVHKSDLVGDIRFVDDLTAAARKQIRLGAFHDASEAVQRLA